MSETVVILPPYMGSQEIVQRSNGASPRYVTGGLEPLGMLVKHRIHDMNEGLIAREEPVTAGEQITLQPSLTHVLAQHFHHAAIPRQVLVDRESFLHPDFIRSLIYGIETVRCSFIRAKDAEVCMF